jgi:hypothetical protein
MKKHLLAILKPITMQLAAPVINEAKCQVRRTLVAVAFAATGQAWLSVGLTYLASSAWHTLVPKLGTVGADLGLGGTYSFRCGCADAGNGSLARGINSHVGQPHITCSS